MVKKKSTTGSAATQKRRSSNVPATYLGFSLQATRFLAHLLKASVGDSVCLEVFEDVGVDKADGSRIAEQDKSALSGNPLSNRSVQFWKTLRNWVEAVAEGTLDPTKTTFVIYASKGNMAPVPASFHGATTIVQAQDAIRQARTTLDIAGDSSESDGAQVKEHLNVVLESDGDRLARIIMRFIVETPSSTPHEDLKPLFLSKLVSDDAYEDVVRWAHGWVKQKVDALIATRKPARVLQAEFHSALLNYVRSHDRLDILHSIAAKPADADVDAELAFRNYIRQLRLIEVDDVDLLAAANDYLRAAIDRTKWAEQGLISESSFDLLTEDLTTTWRNKRDGVFIGHSDKAEHLQGRLLYRDCIEHQARVDGLETPRHFIRGSWHVLSDDKLIGWHPRYLTEVESVTLTPESLELGRQ